MTQQTSEAKTCFICNTHTTNIEPQSSDRFPMCRPCVNAQVKENEAKKAKPERIGIKGILLDRAEGPIDECVSRFCNTFADASRQIIANSQTAPKNGAYDKHDFTILFEDGFSYKGRFDVYHYMSEEFECCLAQHVRDLQTWIIENDADWVTQEQKIQAQEILDKYDLETETLGSDDTEYLLMSLVGADMHDEPEETEPEMETIYVDVTDAAKMVRKDLKAEFPGQKFSVTSERYSGGASINVRWTDGVSRQAVDEILSHYNGATFDGMTDMESPVSHIVDGKKIHYGSKYNHCYRTISEEMMERIANDVAKAEGLEMAGIYELSEITVSDRQQIRWCDVVHRMVDDADLTDYQGVKGIEVCAGNEIPYEIY